MKIIELLKNYYEDPTLKTILHHIDNNKATLIDGIMGSSVSMMISAAATGNESLDNTKGTKKQIQKAPKINLVIANDKEDAENMYSDLSSLLPIDQVYYFSQDEDFITALKHEYKKENLLVSSELLSKLYSLDQDSKINIVTYPSSIIHNLPAKDAFKEILFSLKTGQKINQTTLIDSLYDNKFEKKEFVSQPGEFSVRGEIIDIYSYSEQVPYRIELNFDEIEFIRSFNPETQLSISKISKADIVNYEGLDYENSKELLIDLIPSNTKIWIKNNEYLKALKNTPEYEPLIDNINRWEKKSKEFSKVYLNYDHDISYDAEYKYKTSLQPAYNNKFEILGEELRKFQDSQYSLKIVSKNISQAEQIIQILNEKDHALQIGHIDTNLTQGYVDHQAKMVLFTDHEILNRYMPLRSPKRFQASKSITIRELKALNVGDFVVHVDHGIGKFTGISKIEKNGTYHEVIRLVYQNNDMVYVNVHNIHKIMKYSSKGDKEPQLSKLGTLAWENKKKSVKKKIKELAIDLIALYAKRKKEKGHAFKKDDTMQLALEASFMYEDTPDQALATLDVKRDMEKSYPMDRLICGDVGFGKTEVTIRAAFKAVNDNKQVAVLVPTTVLSMQHYKSFQSRLQEFPVTIELLNRFRTQKQKTQILKDLESGKIDIIIGTHALVSKKVKFKDLGLLIIDEEQKFGVAVKEKIKEAKLNIDVLTLTATPIPRTLNFSLMGARDLSIIATPPPNRKPIETYVRKFERPIIKKAIEDELTRGGQVFFVHNKVSNIQSIALLVQSLVPKARVEVAHGQMDGKLLEKKMIDFINHKYDVLVSTTIIESGLDIPNANTIIINNAQNFGLSDLHQMRGRVGRSNTKAYCYLINPGFEVLPKDARKRLTVLEELSDVGDGFKVAMKDLDIRGAGNILGGEQSGFISDIGFEMYHKILDEAIRELKSTTFKSIFDDEKDYSITKQECLIDTDLEIYIPETYVSSSSERMNLYLKFDNIKNEEEVCTLRKNLKDRFGKIPIQTERLFDIIELKKAAAQLKIEKIRIKKNILGLYFNEKEHKDNEELISKMLSAIDTDHNKYSLKQYKEYLVFKVSNIEDINSAAQAISVLQRSP